MTVIDSLALRKIRAVKAALGELDILVGLLAKEFAEGDPKTLGLPEGANVADALNHLAQVHFRLTDAKGHLGAVSHVARGD